MTLPETWQTLVAKKKSAGDDARAVEKEMATYASSILLASFQQGKWKVSKSPYSPSLVPIDKEAEDALEEVLSVALKMGYHDRFTVEDGHVEIHGQVNDGDLTLSLHTGMKPNPGAIQDDLKRLHLDFDLTEFIRGTTKSALEFAERDLSSLQDRIKSLQKTLAGLPPAPPAPEDEDEDP